MVLLPSNHPSASIVLFVSEIIRKVEHPEPGVRATEVRTSSRHSKRLHLRVGRTAGEVCVFNSEVSVVVKVPLLCGTVSLAGLRIRSQNIEQTDATPWVIIVFVW